MVHILIAYKQFPAPSVGHAGGESLFRLMEALYRRGHRLTLVARIADDERKHIAAVAAICERVYTVTHHRSLPGPRTWALLRSYFSLRAEIQRVIRREAPDFVHVETLQTALVAWGLRRPPATFRTQDVNWYLAEQRAAYLTGFRHQLARLERTVFRWLEPHLCRHYDLTLVVSEGDRRLLAPVCDGPLIMPLTPAVRPTGADPAVPGTTNLVFVGAMSRDHNVAGVTWFLDQVWERVASACPQARFYVVGGSPPPILIDRADGQRVFVTGFVEDLAGWYAAATIFVSPLLVAGGLLQKVLDALAMGKPVVATSVCNHGIGATPGRHLLIADQPDAFADAVVTLLADPEARSRIGAAGQAFVADRYDLEAAVDRWETEIIAMIGGDHRPIP